MSGPLHVAHWLEAELERHGLHLRGVVDFVDGDGGPRLADGGVARQVLLIGNIGGSQWEPFRAWRSKQPDGGGEHPLDAWSKEVVGAVASTCGATAYFPSDPPYQPFQTWAMKAEGLRASPLGILIHPQYGLWHGYRGALGFFQPLPFNRTAPAASHPCETCAEKPCLKTCPAGAVTAETFEVVTCRRHLATTEGRDGCRAKGCLARAACPVGSFFRYPEDQLRFHMGALDLPPG
jgi:ferredoxin-like protein FixX